MTTPEKALTGETLPAREICSTGLIRTQDEPNWSVVIFLRTVRPRACLVLAVPVGQSGSWCGVCLCVSACGWLGRTVGSNGVARLSPPPVDSTNTTSGRTMAS